MSLSNVSVVDGDAAVFGAYDLRLSEVANSNIFTESSSYVNSERRLQYFFKRMFDIGVSAVTLTVLAPIFLLIAIVIKVESRGHVFFRQKRWGQDCSTIKIYKFRSMRSDLCDVSGVAQTVANDPRITRIGRFLRKTNLDELPQLINVLKGDMSLIGPRCHAVGMMAAGQLYEDLVPHYHRRHAMKPGITGLAQARGLRGPTDRASKARARVASDIYYIENFNLALDLLILFWTIKREIRGGTGF
jgi:lipopolysaccharide/colanic/teichoic acid biosynthesis glycosyltransferase